MLRTIAVSAVILACSSAAFACSTAASGHYDFTSKSGWSPKLDDEASVTFFEGRVVVAPNFGPADGVVYNSESPATCEILSDEVANIWRMGERVVIPVIRSGCFLVFDLEVGNAGRYAVRQKEGIFYIVGVSGPSF